MKMKNLVVDPESITVEGNEVLKNEMVVGMATDKNGKTYKVYWDLIPQPDGEEDASKMADWDNPVRIESDGW